MRTVILMIIVMLIPTLALAGEGGMMDQVAKWGVLITLIVEWVIANTDFIKGNSTFHVVWNLLKKLIGK